MCGPALAIAGPIISGIGGLAASGGQADATRTQAAHYRNQAQRERLRGQAYAEQEDTKQRQVTGKRNSKKSSSGFTQASFSDVDQFFEEEKRRSIEAIRWSAEQQARSNDEQADIKLAEADAVEQGGALGALAPVIGGLGKAVTMGGFA